MTREEAIERLHLCAHGHWFVGATCDHCWVDQHRCPPTLLQNVPKQIKALERAAEVGKQAEQCLLELRRLGLEPSR